MAHIRCKNCTHLNDSNAEYCAKCSIPLNESNVQPPGKNRAIENGTFKGTLVLKYGSNKQSVIGEGEYVIGRSKKADITLSNDTFVSGMHAALSLNNGQLYLKDLGSKNGTYLNDSKLSETNKKIKLTDTFRCGQTQFQVSVK